MTQWIEDAEQARRRRILVVGSVVFLGVVAILNGVLNSQIEDEAAALRSDVEQTVAGLGQVDPAVFWLSDETAPPFMVNAGRSMLVTASGAEPMAKARLGGKVRVKLLHRIRAVLCGSSMAGSVTMSGRYRVRLVNRSIVELARCCPVDYVQRPINSWSVIV